MNKRIYGRLLEAGEWKRYLADPDKHWVIGKSARTLAHCWHEANGFPPEVTAALMDVGLENPEVLLAIPEYETALPGQGQGSKTDVMVWINTTGGLACVAVEGKVDEGFGMTVHEWLVSGTGQNSAQNRRTRLDGILGGLGLSPAADKFESLPYQLLHRTASAIVTARNFRARTAVVLVHCFLPRGSVDVHYRAFGEFVRVFEEASGSDNLRVHFAWADGDQGFLSK